MIRPRAACRLAVFVALLLAIAGVLTAGGAGRRPVHIGLVDSLFTDVPAPLARILTRPLKSLIKEHTGLYGEVVTGGDGFTLGKMLDEGKMDLGVFHGFEFAWAQQAYPELRPLMVAVYRDREIRAHLVVRDDSEAAGLADLQGKTAGLAYRSKAHCRLFLERACRECGQMPPGKFFAPLTTPANVETALDEVVGGILQATVVDSIALDCYEQLKPGCFARLKVLHSSEVFPAGVIAYRRGALDRAMLNRFREGMLRANRSERGRDMMALFKVTAFRPVPADYDNQIAVILRAYPPPEKTVPVSR